MIAMMTNILYLESSNTENGCEQSLLIRIPSPKNLAVLLNNDRALNTKLQTIRQKGYGYDPMMIFFTIGEHKTVIIRYRFHSQ